MTATMTTTGMAEDGGTRLFAPRGRHRKPRPRKVLLAAGGLALAAGALSLVRLTPDVSVGGFGATEPDPQAAPGADTDIDTGTSTGTGTGTDTGADRATNAAATVGSVPQASPSSTTAMGGITAIPTPGVSPARAGSATAVPLPLAAAPTTIPDAPNTPAPARTPTADTTPRAPATTAAPRPAPTTPPPASTPTPQPTHAAQPAPGLCVPIIGLCVRQGG
ncbi:hypothetical protein ABZT02_25855 [Streptomyces sp. NPDC005402]|uniref:hypothetical protein n=1 Tax=Streptomyces sp. NPDC005402 TaxID=3155338 RepID=UPI0033BC3536